MNSLPLPPAFPSQPCSAIFLPDYGLLSDKASRWKAQHAISDAHTDRVRRALLLIDVQNTFCIPDRPLFVGGRSGQGAVEDNERLVRWIYEHLAHLTEIVATLDTHTPIQIFHPVFWVNHAGQHPAPFTSIALENWSAESGISWCPNPQLAPLLGLSTEALSDYASHYVQALKHKGQYTLTIWPYHSLLGSPDHALVSAVQEALFFHGVARNTQARIWMKGDQPLTEHYSVFRPEADPTALLSASLLSASLAPPPKPALFDERMRHLATFDEIYIAGQAKSHCVLSSLEDLVRVFPPSPSHPRLILLDNASSPVVVPGVVDWTQPTEQAIQALVSNGLERMVIEPA